MKSEIRGESNPSDRYPQATRAEKQRSRNPFRAHSVPAETVTREDLIRELDGSHELLPLRSALIQSSSCDSSHEFYGPSGTLRRSSTYNKEQKR